MDLLCCSFPGVFVYTLQEKWLLFGLFLLIFCEMTELVRFSFDRRKSFVKRVLELGRIIMLVH